MFTKQNKKGNVLKTVDQGRYCESFSNKVLLTSFELDMDNIMHIVTYNPSRYSEEYNF